MTKFLFMLPDDLVEVPVAGASVPDETFAELDAFIRSEYTDALPDGEGAYLSAYSVDRDNFVFGALNPDELKSTVSRWNKEIQKEAKEAMEAVLESGMEEDTSDIVSPEVYRLKVAAIALSDSFYPYADKMVDIENEFGYSYIRSKIPQAMKEDILANPENYCIATIFPK